MTVYSGKIKSGSIEWLRRLIDMVGDTPDTSYSIEYTPTLLGDILRITKNGRVYR